jgi:DNA-binding winged helix-turn-helix (wHTH) protein/alpha-beta hydrolase superfamily lysophospholipase
MEQGGVMIYSFADCSLDTERYTLLRNGVEVHVEPQVFDVLRLLVENAGNLITSEQLIARVWNGRSISDAAISSRINAARTSVGDNGKAQRVIKTLPRRGFKLVPTVEVAGMTRDHVQAKANQVVRYARSKDGTDIAYAVTGQGPKLLRTGHFLTHLEHDWTNAVWRPYLDRLGVEHSVVRYDQRGTGLSIGNPEDLSIEAQANDLLAVADAAAMEQFPLIATSQGVPVAIHFAANHPERVTRLVLYGGFAQGRLMRGERHSVDEANALLTMVRAGWGNPNSAFMMAFNALYCPTATQEELNSLAKIQLASATPEMAARVRTAIDTIDIMSVISSVNVPTLVIHARHETLNPISQGRLLASHIPNAEFIEVDSPNHIILPSHPTFDEILSAKLKFIAGFE